MESKKLKVGDKYLSISLDSAKLLALSMKAVNDGEQFVSVAAFKSDNGDDPNKPVYESFGVKVWLNKKKEKIQDSDL